MAILLKKLAKGHGIMAIMKVSKTLDYSSILYAPAKKKQLPS